MLCLLAVSVVGTDEENEGFGDKRGNLWHIDYEDLGLFGYTFFH